MKLRTYCALDLRGWVWAYHDQVAWVTACEPVRPGTGVPRGRELRR